MATKLNAPWPRPHLVHRPRLLQRLQQGREGALTVLSAPAGFGKSTLLGDWLSSCAIPAAWLALEPQDDDPARLRGRDDLLELRAADLRFTDEETTSYLVEVMGLPLSAEQSGLLQARTEGWITGLHLAALTLLNHDDPAGFITAFSGSHRYVVEYLLEEVLSRQSEAIEDFLL